MEIEKQSREDTTFPVNVSGLRELQAGENISNIDVEVTLNGQQTEGIYVSHTNDGPTVFVRVKDGETGKNYKITLLVTTNHGHVREVDVFMYVREK